MNTAETNRFNELAKDWDTKPDRVERARKFGDGLLQLIRKHQLKTALDYGAGTGLVSFYLLDHLEHICLLDMSEGMLEVMQRKIDQYGVKNASLVQADLIHEELTDKYDLIYILMTLHHILDTQKILKAFYQHLNPGGWLCIGDLTAEDGSFHYKYPEFDGHNGFDESLLTQQLKSTGFEAVESNIFYQIEKDINGKIKNFPLFFMSARKK